MGAIFWIVLAVVVVYAITLYNSLVNVKNAVSKAWANIDVLLKHAGKGDPGPLPGVRGPSIA